MNARIDNRSAAAPVRLAGLRKAFENGVVAVHGVDLDIQAGEFVVLVGPSGCGKTTTLRMVAGLESISAGTLTIGGRVVNDVPPAERDIAMVFQTYALYPHMTVRENLGFALRLRKRSRAEIAARVAAAAETLGLTSLLDRTPRQLSGGQRQRVAIGRAIVREPSVFLFDEPLSNLDAALRSEMRRELAALHRTLGATMLYVTHDQVEAMTLGDRIVVMSEGRVRQVDAPSAVYQHPRDTFVAGFLGSPPMNLLSGVLVRGDSRRLVQLAAAPQVRVAMPAQMPDPPSREVILGVRPEHLEVCTEGAGAENERFAATLELAEPLGHEHLLHLRVGDAKLTARCEPAAWPRIGSTLYVRPETDRIHLFDAATGMSLSAGG